MAYFLLLLGLRKEAFLSLLFFYMTALMSLYLKRFGSLSLILLEEPMDLLGCCGVGLFLLERRR